MYCHESDLDHENLQTVKRQIDGFQYSMSAMKLWKGKDISAVEVSGK